MHGKRRKCTPPCWFSQFSDYVTEFIINSDEKFFLVEIELAALNAIQPEIAAIQDKNRVIIQEQLTIYE